MDFEFYHNFITVAETKNLTLAAQKLSLAQPALTAQIKTLENHYGVKLIETSRGRRTLKLTDAGIDFLTRAQQICEIEELISIEMGGYNKQVNGTLRFGVSFNVAQQFLDKFIQPFVKLQPKINFQLREMTTAEQIKSVKEGLIDFGYANAPMPDISSFTCKKIKQEKFYVVYSKDNEWNFKPAVPVVVKDLKGIPLACNYGIFGLIRQLCQDEGFVPEIKFIADNGFDTVNFASNGTCIAVASDNCSEKLLPNTKRMVINNEQLTYAQTIFWCNTQKMTPAIKSFADYVLSDIGCDSVGF